MAFTFDQLNWQDHALGFGAKQALHAFENGYTLSVVYGPHTSGDGEDTFEAAVIIDRAKGKLLDLTPYGWDDNAAAWADREDIETLANRVANLSPLAGR